ncbi:M28 family peptidase [Sphingosinicella sp.]|uniref:M28 family peptidase n=1 Tax=Sphingosinicella sp. TaxID=1917971 RepID=UPI00403784DD
MRAILIAFLTLFATASATAQQRAAQPQISLDTVQRVTRELSSDAFEGRAPGTPGETRTVEAIAREFQRAGLRPGNNGAWYQDVPLVEITLQGNPQLQVTGGRGAPITLNYRTDFVAASYRAQPRIDVRDSEVVFVGYGINAPERGWNDYAGLDVRGRTVIILVNDADWNAAGMEGIFGGRAMTYYGRWTYKFEEAARQGAAAAMIVHDTAPASYGWNVVENSWTGPQLYMRSADNGANQTAANGWLTNEAARRLLAAAGQDLDALTRAAQQRGFRPVPLGLRVSLGFDNALREAMSRNVIGILPGTTRANEYVLNTAHWDHLGICRETGEDRICNGAVDNASGTAALVALAEAQARAGRTARSQIFLAVTAEESGLLGSAYYAANPIYPLARTAGGLNIDSLTMHGDARDFYAVGAGKSELDAWLGRAVQAEGLTLSPSEPSPEAGYYFRSDQFSLAKLGVPMIYAKLGDDLVNGGRTAGRAWAQTYRANRYHGPDDEYDENWDWSGAMRELRIFYRIGRELAESNEWPNWNQGDEFRAIRDRTADQRR